MAKISSTIAINSFNRTSELINDGEHGNSRFVEEDEIQGIVEEIVVVVGGDKHFSYEQIAPSKIWVIFHDLNKRPSVSVTDTAGTEVRGNVTINDGERVVIEFNFPFSGYANLN